MKLWLDGQCLQTASRLRGIGRYVQEFVGALSRHDDLRLMMSFNAAMAEEALAAREAVSAWIRPDDIHMWEGPRVAGEGLAGLDASRRLGAIALAHHVACLAPDVAISTSVFEGERNMAVPLEPGPLLRCPVGSIFYDAIPHRYPDRYLNSAQLRAAYERRLRLFSGFDVNLCISRYSTEECGAAAGGRNNIDIGAGVSEELLKLRSAPPAAVPSGPYVLYVGGLDWRKNVGAIISAFDLLPPSLRETVRFVLAGDHHEPQLGELLSQWRMLGLPADRVTPLAHVSELQLVSLYRSAALVVQPSYLEGFGLTMLEAMSCGAPVAAAARGAAPEVVGDPDLLFDPDDHARLAEIITRMIEDPGYARAKAEDGRVRAEAYSWQKSADVAATALRRVAAARPVKPTAISNLRSAALNVVRRDCAEAPDVAEIMARAEPLAPAPPRLFVDCTSVLINDAGTGIQRVTRQISSRLVKKDGAIIIYGDNDTSLQQAPVEGGRPMRPTSPDAGLRILPRGRDVVLMLDSSWEYHRTHLEQLLPARLRGVDVVSTLYDLVPLRVPALCHEGMPMVFGAWLQSALTYSNGFICISRAVAEELHALLQAIDFPRTMKIAHWPLGANFAPLSDPVPRSEHPNFLMVGTIEPRKGHAIVLDAFDRLWAEGRDMELTIVGKPGWNTERLIERLGSHAELGRRLHFKPSVDDQELARLYGGADALISASYAEGFGLPLVEARHFRKPIIASDLPVFREVTAGASDARFFKVGDSGSLITAILDFVAKRDEVARPSPEDREWPDWDESARRLHDVVVGNEWPIIYRPRESKPYASIAELGTLRMTRMLEPGEREHRIDVVSVERSHAGLIQIAARIANLSGHPWSSGFGSGEFAFELTARAFSGAARLVGADVHATLPFVLPSGQEAILRLDVPDQDGEVATIEISARQRGGDQWEAPLRLEPGV